MGISAGYEDAAGRPRATSDATREALLDAMGLAVADEAQAERALRALEERDRAPDLEPAVLHFEDEHPVLRLRAPEGAGEVAAQLEVREESGRMHRAAQRARVSRSGRLLGLSLPRLPLGVHRVRLALQDGRAERDLEQTWIVAPRRCPTPAERLGSRRTFGLWANLYAVRGPGGLGVGSLRDLARLVELAAREGADFVGVNPLHALRNRPPDVSPYQPLSRLFRNPLYLDVEAVPELTSCEAVRRRLASRELRARLEALRGSPWIDYAAAASLHEELLAPLHRAFRRAHAREDTARGRAYRAFRRRHGELLERFCAFRVAEETLGMRGVPTDPARWPDGFRHPGGEELRKLVAREAERIDFHAFQQFELDRQLAAAAAAARRRGLAVGLYQDLALGSAPSGFDPWAFPGLFVRGARLGAPPDAYAAEGQDWGLPPLDPHRQAADGFLYWRLLLGAALDHAGALRVDHAMGVLRQFWIPLGRPPSEGAYVRCPARELLGCLALESRRRGALVVGEDLGTVPRGFASLLARFGILSSRVLLFERDRGAYRPARAYSRRALVTTHTHDLPSLPAFLAGRDLELRRELGLFEDDGAWARAVDERGQERRALVRRLVRAGHLPPTEGDPPSGALVRAAYAFLAETPAPLVGVSLDDLTGETEPVNVPGVPPERHASWTRRMSRHLDALATDPGARRVLAEVRVRREGPR